ncbi:MULTISPECIES: T7SS effector LXG polymorphic toxin [Bacillus amyloliquefaciens group]|nr:MULTISPECIES: T7SS effector LXG polymorphic toxin [Bacillus amyloliquefaciens group]MCR4366922.1 T7SS effector LXG polymorphic toxin [Bacillus amyloliquefaciens]MCR4371939.1 T7SS effector LXG polymorphic toxin [Bacillus amyloliquefaciens]MCV3198932.1 T7SS effector LXG polymorphic toxin [Bacillus velezensis]MDP1502573.1 T7SS effector LXG polymorphic toxin [Bacillus velezensis]MDP1506432.1 T7SS effector LXG polymorphic toxin [Bacillus velezensis]
MSKVFESQSLTDEADKRKKQYEALEEQLRALKQAFQGVADLGDALKGKGADNIKDFFQGQAEIADSWLTLVSAQIAFLNGISGDIKDQELSDTYVETSFLEHELPNADLKASEIVSAHKAEIDSILSGISDIIHLDTYTLDDYADKMGDAQKTRRDTITAVDTLDESLTAEYQNLESLDNAVLSKYSVLMQATSNGKSASPMYYDKKAFHSNEIYKSVTATEKQGTDYIDAKAQQAEARRLQEKAEEEANKPWYEKTWDGICNFTGEVTGYYDYKRAAEGVDPVTGEKLSTAERVTAGAMAAAGFIPVVGWAGRAFKGGKAIYKTGKTVIAAEHALDAYKTGKSLDILKMTEMGAYGLVASNGFTEAVTGRDMFGNKVSEEKRKQGALEAALSLVGAGALAKHVNKGIPLAKSPQASKVEKGKKILDQVKEFKVPTNVKIRVHKTVTPDGATFPIIHADVKTTAVKDLGIVKMAGSGSSGSTPTRLIPGTPGKVTGGSSTKLGKNMFEQMGLPRSTKRTPYQAQHIIPKEFRNHPVLKKLGMDMDDASNGFFLRVPEDDISATSRHKGYHSVYSSFVRKKLDEIDVNQSVDVIEKQVYGLQQKLRELQEKGLPLYMRDDYLQTELKKIKEKGFEAYKLERKEDSASRKPVWKRGGGATVDLWERWYNK